MYKNLLLSLFITFIICNCLAISIVITPFIIINDLTEQLEHINFILGHSIDMILIILIYIFNFKFLKIESPLTVKKIKRLIDINNDGIISKSEIFTISSLVVLFFISLISLQLLTIQYLEHHCYRYMIMLGINFMSYFTIGYLKDKYKFKIDFKF